MGVEFGRFHQQEPEGEVIDEHSKFRGLYQDYRKIRRQIHDNPDNFDRRRAVDEVRERLAVIVMGIYQDSSDIKEFEHKLRQLIPEAAGIDPDEFEQYIAAASVYPFLLNEKNEYIPSPMEAIWTTCENLKIIGHILNECKPYTSGILVSGSYAHGPFYSVKGGTPKLLVDMGMKPKKYSEFSDIDFLMTFSTLKQMRDMVLRLVGIGILDPKEKERMEYFEQLNQSRKVEVFSVRSYYGNVEESYHLILDSSLDKITSFDGRKDEESGLGYLADFRENMPKTADSGGKYPFRDVLDQITIDFDPKPVSVKAGSDIGYLSRIPVGGVVEFDDQGQAHQSYIIGVLAFFLQVCPAVLHDRDGRLNKGIDQMRERIKGVLGGENPSYINRQNKMLPHILEKVKNSFES